MTDLNTVANNMGETIAAFRKSAVTTENKATPMARSILAAMLTGVATEDKVTIAVIASFGNPTSPKTGKPVAKLSGLRDFVGGDATRKTVETIVKIHANVKGHDALTKLVTSFILDAQGAPKSLRALDVAVKDTLKAEAAADPANADGAAETNTGTNDDTATAPSETIADRINKLALEIAGTSDDEFQLMGDNIAALRKAIADRTDAYAIAKLKLVA